MVVKDGEGRIGLKLCLLLNRQFFQHLAGILGLGQVVLDAQASFKQQVGEEVGRVVHLTAIHQEGLLVVLFIALHKEVLPH